MEGEALRVAVAPRQDGGHRAGAVHERIVGRDTAIAVDTVQLAQGCGEILSVLHVTAFTHAEQQSALRIEGEPRTIMHAAGRVAIERRAEQGLRVYPFALFVEAAAHDHCHRWVIGRPFAGFQGGRRRQLIAGLQFNEAKVDPARLAVIRVHRHVHQAGILAFPYQRRVLHGLRQQPALAIDDAQLAGAFGHQHAAIG